METIRNLFDKNKDIYRSIEKVISYNALQEKRLKAEISEYVVTTNIEEQFEKLLWLWGRVVRMKWESGYLDSMDQVKAPLPNTLGWPLMKK